MNPIFTPVPPRIKKILSRRRSKKFKLRLISGLVTVGFILFIFFLVGTTIAFGYFARNLPSPNKLSEKNFGQSTKIYDRNGILLYNVYGEQNRTLVKLDKIPKDLQNATVAIEDKNFYKHKGFDFVGIIRAAKDAVFKKKVTGGSTLTQQLVKNALLTPERTVTRKMKEFILAVQIERRYNKKEILQIYLNEIPYGGTAWGSEAAAEQYFGKHVWELSLLESAVLAGLPQKPTAYSPFGSDPTAYIVRTKDVLRRMREDKYITKAQEKKAVKQLPHVQFATYGQGIKAPHFSIHVKNLLEEKYGAKLVQEGGLRVTTSLDLSLQNMAQQVIADEISRNGQRLRMSNSAAIIENVKTGEILAMVGSKDYFAQDIQGNFNVATQGLRQPGSALKPFNYLLGFEKGYSPSTIFLDERTDFGGGYTPGNYCDCFNGPLSVRVALGSSRNIPAVKMLGVNGVAGMVGKLKQFNITTLNNPSQYGLSLTLGGGAIRLSELTNAYAILGNEGRSLSPQVILKVTDSDGNVIEEFNPEKIAKNKLSAKPEHVYLINNILSDPSAKYMDYGNYWAHRLNFQENLAVKTGTSEMRIDNWSFGYTPSYVVGVWVGNNDNSPMHPSLSSGVTGAAPIWRTITENVLKGKPIDKFKQPDNVVRMDVDSQTGQQPVAGSPTKSELFVKYQPPPKSDMRKEVKICEPTGLLANSSCEAAGKAVTKAFLVLVDPYTKLYMPSYRYCNPCPPTESDQNTYTPGSDELTLVITAPSNNSTVGTSFTVTIQVSGPKKILGVEYYIDNNLKDTKTSPPYTQYFTGVSPGNHKVEVKAYDDSGDSIKESINVKVVAGGPLGNSPP